jgi:hypothetical protein
VDVSREVTRAVLAALLTLGGSALAGGQSAAAPNLKAAFLYNFVKFTQWPADALGPQAPLAMCATDEAVVDALTRATAGRDVDGHPLAVRRVAVDGADLRSCHVLYAPALNDESARQLLDAVKDAPVMTVSDFNRFVALGGVARFFMEGSQMRFAISPEMGRRARLQLSSKLLSLAKIE